MDAITSIILRSNLDDLVNFIQHFWLANKYSVFNCILIYAQRPGAIMLATEKQWKTNYNRNIKHETTPIVILKPFGPVDFIYDYDDTYGKTELYPKRLTLTKSLEIQDWWTDALIEQLFRNGIFYSERNFGSRQGADIGIIPVPRSYTHILKTGKQKPIVTDCCITVNSMSDSGAKFISILHELGHLFCGHLQRGKHTPKNLVFSNRTKENLSKNQKEFEAELTKNLVCSILGIKIADPFSYLMGYTDENGERPEVDYNEIIKAVDRILNLIPNSISNDAKRNIDDYQVNLFDF